MHGAKNALTNTHERSQTSMHEHKRMYSNFQQATGGIEAQTHTHTHKQFLWTDRIYRNSRTRQIRGSRVGWGGVRALGSSPPDLCSWWSCWPLLALTLRHVTYLRPFVFTKDPRGLLKASNMRNVYSRLVEVLPRAVTFTSGLRRLSYICHIIIFASLK